MSKLNVADRLKAKQETRKQKSKRPANKLIVVEGFEGKGDKAVLIGKDAATRKDVRVTLRPESSPGENARPTIDAMMAEKYEHKVDVGGIVMAEGCFDNGPDGSELSASWLSTYQHKSSADAKKWLMVDPSERNEDDNIRLALNGPCNVTLVESREYQDAGGNPVITKPKMLVDMYSTPKAKLTKVSSIEEMQSLVAEAISPKNVLIESDTTAVIRYIDKEANSSFVIGVPSSRTIMVNDEYVTEDPSITAANYMEGTLKSPDSAMSALAEAFAEGETLDIEYVPASRFAVLGKSLTNLKVFDGDGKIKRSAEGAKSKTRGEVYQSMYRTVSDGQKQVRLLDTSLYAIFYGNSNSPIVGGFKSTGGYTKAYTLDKLPTENFTPTVEAKKPYNQNSTAQSNPQSDAAKSAPAESKPQSKQVDTASNKPAPEPVVDTDELSEDDLNELDAQLDELDMPSLP